MGIITRSEASHRLKLISTKVNDAARSARDGHWKECADAASEAWSLLEILGKHLDEAAHVEGEVVASIRVNPVPQRVGGMGYTAKHPKSPSASTPPKPIYTGSGNNAPPKPIITPPPAPSAPKPAPRQVFVTPPPEPSAPQPQEFDPAKIWFNPMRLYADDRTDEEINAARIWISLPDEVRDRIYSEFMSNGGNPVGIAPEALPKDIR